MPHCRDHRSDGRGEREVSVNDADKDTALLALRVACLEGVLRRVLVDSTAVPASESRLLADPTLILTESTVSG